MPNEITIKHEVTDQFLYDVLTNAVESNGLSYWAKIQLVVRRENLDITEFQVADAEDASDAYYDRLYDGMSEEDAQAATDNDKDVWSVVDKDMIVKGINEIMSGKLDIDDDIFMMIVRAVSENDADIDATGCDCIVQAALFGEITYG